MKTYDLLDAFNAVDEEQLEQARRVFEPGKETIPMKKPLKLMRTLLIAAVITALLGVTAYAAGLFGLSLRETAPEETFPVRFSVQGEEVISGVWTGTAALEFDEPAVCQPIRYRFDWLPEGYKVPDYCLAEDGWILRTDWYEGSDLIPWCEHTEVVHENRDFFVSDVYYVPQFVNGGALILLDTIPEEVQEDTWGDLSVLRFVSRQMSLDYGDHIEIQDYDQPRNFVVLYHPEQGWIFTIRGTCPLEDLSKIAENTVFEQTDGEVTPEQFQNPYDFFDAARG